MLFLVPESEGLMPPVKEHSNIESDHVSISVQIIKPDGAKAWPFLVFLHHALGSIGQWKDFPERLAAKTG